MPNCIHGLPGYCCAVCNRACMVHPEFRRKREDKDEVRFGASYDSSDARMRAAARDEACLIENTRRPARMSVLGRAQRERDMQLFLTMKAFRPKVG